MTETNYTYCFEAAWRYHTLEEAVATEVCREFDWIEALGIPMIGLVDDPHKECEC